MVKMDTSAMKNSIEYGLGLEISHAKLHYKASKTTDGVTIIINNTSLLDKYFDLIKMNTEDYEMTDAEYVMYKFQPKRFCLDQYGTVELWSALLKINNIFSASQFTKKKIKIFNSSIFEIINEIIILEDFDIKENNEQVYKS